MSRAETTDSTTTHQGTVAPLAEAIAQALAEAGTRTVYGVPGGGNNLDLVGACERAGLRFVLAHGETAAAMMAAVDGELTGAPGACIVTRGPGAASAVNAVAHALLDRVPMVLLSDAVPAGDATRISHQRLEQDALYAPVTKWSASVGVDGAREVVDAALRLACTPPFGPVHLGYVPDAPRVEPPTVPVLRQPEAEALTSAEHLLGASRRPVLAIGVGARRAEGALRALLEGTGWPVLTTYKAKGLVPESWPNAAGLLTGATIEAPVLAGADLIVAVGLDPVELIPAPWPYRAPILALSEWPLEDPYFVPNVELVGSFEDLLPIIGSTLGTASGPGRVERLAAEATLRVPTNGLAPHDIVDAARELAPSGTIATVDAGAHMLVAMPLWEVEEPGEALISSGLATMGFALPAAIAAAIARPGRQVVCFVGDGGLGMALAELETVSRLELPIAVVVFNDSALSLIEIKQNTTGHGGKGAVRYRETDFTRIAEGFGIAAARANDVGQFRAAFRDALAEPRPFLIDAAVDPSGYGAVLAAIRGGSRLESDERHTASGE
jgi:acetolactate synthase-1/2/3 large subunit